VAGSTGEVSACARQRGPTAPDLARAGRRRPAVGPEPMDGRRRGVPVGGKRARGGRPGGRLGGRQRELMRPFGLALRMAVDVEACRPDEAGGGVRGCDRPLVALPKAGLVEECRAVRGQERPANCPRTAGRGRGGFPRWRWGRRRSSQTSTMRATIFAVRVFGSPRAIDAWDQGREGGRGPAGGMEPAPLTLADQGDEVGRS